MRLLHVGFLMSYRTSEKFFFGCLVLYGIRELAEQHNE